MRWTSPLWTDGQGAHKPLVRETAAAPTHQLQDNSPTENVVAMYEAVNQYGAYV